MSDSRSAEGHRSAPKAEACRAYVEAYLGYLGGTRNVAAHTIKAYRSDISSYLDWCDRASVDPLTLTTPELRRWLGELRRARYAPRTLNRKLSALRGFYGWLVERDLASTSALATMPGPKMGRHLPKVVGDREVRQMLAAVDGESAWDVFDRALVEFLYATGARIQEASNVNLDDIDLSRGSVTLFGKGSKERLVPVYPKARIALSAYLDRVRPERALRTTTAKGATEDDARALFLSQRGRRMSAAALRRRFEGVVERAGLPPTITPHTMRHTFATELLNGDADLRSVQELLGHASLSTTQIYTNLSIERLGNVMRQAHPRGE